AEGVAPDVRPVSVEERWILSRLDEARELLEEAIPAFGFSGSVQALYHLTFDDFCDWYAESVKPRLYDGDGDARATALAALERLRKEIERAERMLGNERFLAKAPADVVESERAKLERYRRELETIGD